tara:strand:- start:32 stop:418 length:387 start_codon:yes stop_codon:yes gene_type:complete
MKIGRGSLLRSSLKNGFATLDITVKDLALHEGVRHRFLAINVLTVFESRHHLVIMPVIWSGHHHRINVLALTEGAIIFEDQTALIPFSSSALSTEGLDHLASGFTSQSRALPPWVGTIMITIHIADRS